MSKKFGHFFFEKPLCIVAYGKGLYWLLDCATALGCFVIKLELNALHLGNMSQPMLGKKI